MKILVVGHSCAPNRGSEPGLTWQFAWHLSRLHEVWVMSSARFRDAIEEQLALSPNPNLHFLWIEAPYLTPRARSEVTLRVRYLFWQRAVLREARRQHRRHQFDLVHHLSWGTISAPPLLWRLPIPFVWGPVGGAQTAPPAYRRYFGSAWRDELLRTFRVNLVTRMPGLRRTVRNCALILSTNPETTRALQTAGARDVRFHPNIGVTEESLRSTIPRAPRASSGPVILWAGRLIPIKGLPLALEAFAQLDPNLHARLRIAGDGPIRSEMESLAKALGVAERVDFLGAVPWLEMNRQYQEADLFLFTSLRDSSGQVLAEAMGSGLPIVALNHHGTGAIVPPAAGIRVSVENPDQTVRALTEAMQGLISSPASRERMGQAGRLHAQGMSWNAHAEIMSRWYAQVLAQRQLNDEYAYAAV
jgi:glycosyltransferase involved in cell wall biosynthesis